MTVYAMLHAFSNEVAAEWRKTQRLNLALALTALFVRRSLTLSHLAQHFPLSEQPKVPRPKHSLWHRLKRLRRFLSNQKIGLEPTMQRLTHMALVVSDEPGKRISLLLDLTYLDPYAFLVISVPKGGRALPLGWHAFCRNLVGEAVDSQNQLIDRLVSQVLARIPATLTAVVVGDREFARASFFRCLHAQQRDFVIRVDKETWITHPDYTGPMGALAKRPGMKRRWLPGALYGQEAQVLVNLLVLWKRGYEQPWLLATSLSDPNEVFAIYRSRMKIEHGFRDWKTHLRLRGTLLAQNVAYVKGLMTILALLYWFICLCGLHWNYAHFRSRVACWGKPSFFKIALDLLTSQDPLAFSSWPNILAWLQDKLAHLRPLPKPYLLRYRKHRPPGFVYSRRPTRLPQTG
jgi:hypothetical protein